MKIPKCPICGGKHYKFQCWRARKPLRGSESRSKTHKAKKVYSLTKSTKKSRQTLVRELDRVFSELVRRRYANSRGYTKCYTCGKVGHWTTMDCGHYFKRGHLHTRWDFQDARQQCKRCNRVLGGNYQIYEKKIREELGEATYKELEQKAYDTSKIPTVELEIMLENLKKALNSLS